MCIIEEKHKTVLILTFNYDNVYVITKTILQKDNHKYFREKG